MSALYTQIFVTRPGSRDLIALETWSAAFCAKVGAMGSVDAVRAADREPSVIW